MDENENMMELVNDLIDQGYSIDFNLLERAPAADSKLGWKPAPSDFQIDQIYCFRQPGDPNEVFVLTLSSRKYGFKGILIKALSTCPDRPWKGIRQQLADVRKRFFKR